MYRFANGGTVPDPLAGKQTSTESSLSPWAGPTVTDMLGRGTAIAQTPYEAYAGPLTAGPSELQTKAFEGIAGLTIPTAAQTTYNPQMFTAQAAQGYMNPYLMAALQPQIDEARRQSDISRVQQAGRLGRAGAYGGSRQAIMESELERGLGANLANITGRGYQTAYDKAMDQFNTEQNRQMQAARQAQQYGLEALGAQTSAGATQRGIDQEGIAADIKQFEEERDYPYKQIQFEQSLLKGLPLQSATYGYQPPSGISEFMGSAAGILGFLKQLGIIK